MQLTTNGPTPIQISKGKAQLEFMRPIKASLLLAASCVIVQAAFGQAPSHAPTNAVDLGQSHSSSEDAVSDFEKLEAKLASSLKQEVAYDEKLASHLRDFAMRDPADDSSLTAKVYLAFYFAVSRQDTRLAERSRRDLGQKAAALFTDIAASFPNTWQGKLASIYDAELLGIEKTPDKGLLIARARRALPVLSSIEKHSGFERFQRTFNASEPVEISLRSQICALLLDTGDLKGARQELEMLRKKYPKSKAAARLEKRLVTR